MARRKSKKPVAAKQGRPSKRSLAMKKAWTRRRGLSNESAAASLPDDPKKRREVILGEAREIICGEREKTHGPARVNLSTIARMQYAFWDGVRESRPSGPFDAIQFRAGPVGVALDMILVKMGRIACGEDVEQDHLRDIIGYAALAAELTTPK